MIRRPPRSTQSRSSAASDVYKRQERGDCAAARARIPGWLQHGENLRIGIIHAIQRLILHVYRLDYGLRVGELCVYHHAASATEHRIEMCELAFRVERSQRGYPV